MAERPAHPLAPPVWLWAEILPRLGVGQGSLLPPSLPPFHPFTNIPSGPCGGRARPGSWEALCRLATPCCQRGGTRRHRHTQSHAPHRLTFSSSCLSCFVRASREHMVCWGATTVQIHLPSLSWAELYTCQLSSGLVGSTWGAGGEGEGGRESETREHRAVHDRPRPAPRERAEKKRPKDSCWPWRGGGERTGGATQTVFHQDPQGWKGV